MHQFHISARLGTSSQCQINNEVARRPWHWGAPLACKFTRPQSNWEFVGTGEKENVEGAIKHPRGTQRCHSKSVDLCHTWGLLSSFIHVMAHSGSYCSKGCCYQVLLLWQLMFSLNCIEFESFFQYNIIIVIFWDTNFIVLWRYKSTAYFLCWNSMI